MYHSILVPLDGSRFAEEALPVAAAVAKNTGACLEIAQVHICCTLQSTAGGWEPYYDAAYEKAAKAQDQTHLQEIVQRLKTSALVSATSTLLDGPVVDALLQRARSRSIDLIVMSTHGRGPLGRFCVGSVAADLLSYGPAPILLVRPNAASETPLPAMSVRRVMVALDGSDLAELAIEPAISLAAYEYLLARVVERPIYSNSLSEFSDETEARHSAEAETYLDTVAARLRARGLRVQTRVVVERSAAGALLATAQRESIDVVALATHGRTGLVRLLVGSVAGEVVQCADRPVLVCPPDSRPLKKPPTARRPAAT
jgi:nucleotide-binding universal stress UspA family protein